MGYFYFIRHGQTEYNIAGKVCGASDAALTQKGIAQAKELAAKLKEENIQADRILSSPLKRALCTAEYIADALGLKAEAEERLKEQSFGRWEGTPNKAQEFLHAKTCFIDSYDGGESMFKVVYRVYDLLHEITNDPDHVYILVAHNGIARIIESYFHDMTNEQFSTYAVPNCSLIKYEF